MESPHLHGKLVSAGPKTISVGEFVRSGIKFFIPSYQRGYRWGSDEIVRLLKDINEYDKERDGDFYCLQPVVVRFDRNNEQWRLVDGQQRLTTISIILANLDEEPLTILYERDEMKSPVEQHYLRNARKIIPPANVATGFI